MNNRKPGPLFPDGTNGKMCPVCGKRSYSLTGIHPQCAVQQADAPRQKVLAEEKKERERQRVAAAHSA